MEDFCSRGFTDFEDVATSFLLLQAAEEGFDHRGIRTIPSTTHAWQPPIRLPEPIPFIAADLCPLIRVDDDMVLGVASPNGHPKGVQCDLFGLGGCHRSTNDPAGIGISPHRQVQPAFVDTNRGHVGHPGPIGSVHRKRLPQSIWGRHRRLSVPAAWLLGVVLGADRVALQEPGHAIVARALTDLRSIDEKARGILGAAPGRMRPADQTQ